MATVVAGPGCARYLADYGADVIKVERPGGDTARGLGWKHPTGGDSLWWKILARNKSTIELDLKDPDDLAVMKSLCDSADVLVENFRPGTLERLGLDPTELIKRNPKLVVTRVTGFGQDGPYRDRPAFATQAEANAHLAARGLPLLSAQAAALLGRIREAGAVARGDERIHEVFPEASFRQLAGAGLAHAKRSAAGALLRVRLLEQAEPAIVVPVEVGAAGAIPLDDLLDAAAAAWSARRCALGTALAFGDPEELDVDTGRRIAMWV